MSNKKELRIYGVSCYVGATRYTHDYATFNSQEFSDNEKGNLYTDENGVIINEFDNEQISRLTDLSFMDEAEESGNVWSLDGFLRDIESRNFGGKSWAVAENMQFRAYLVDLEDGGVDPIRVDISEIKMSVADVGYSL